MIGNASLSTVSTFIAQVKNDENNFCPMHLTQAEDFLSNYFCLSPVLSTSTELTLIDEDQQLGFFSINSDLLNNTEQTIDMVRRVSSSPISSSERRFRSIIRQYFLSVLYASVVQLDNNY